MKKVIFKSLFTSILLVLGLSVGVKQTTHEVVEAAEGKEYLLVTDSTNLKVGDTVVIANTSAKQALSTTQNNNNRGAINVEITDGVLKGNEEVQELILEEGTKEGTFAFRTNNGYLYAASSSKNHLKTKDSIDDNASWQILIDSSNTTITAQGNYTRNEIRYNPNNNSPIFSCYASGQDPVQLYKVDISTFVVTFKDATSADYVSETYTYEGYDAVIEGQTIVEPTQPAKRGYTFLGWYKEDTCDNLFDFATETITANTTLYAGWVSDTATQYTVKFDGNGAANTMNDVILVPEADEAVSYTLPENEFVFEGKVFTGWSVNEESKKPGDEILVSADTTITATWREYITTSELTFDKNLMRLEVGEVTTLSLTNNGDDTPTWNSSNPTVATITGNEVKALSKGTTTITAEVNGVKAECLVIVEIAQEATVYKKITGEQVDYSGRYLVAYVKDNSAIAMKNSENEKQFIDVSTNKLAISNDLIMDYQDAAVFEIIKNSDGTYSLTADGTNYVSYPGSGNSAGFSSYDESDEGIKFNITSENDVFKFESVKISGRYLQYNTSSPRFACYTQSSKQQDLTLFKETVQKESLTNQYDQMLMNNDNLTEGVRLLGSLNKDDFFNVSEVGFVVTLKEEGKEAVSKVHVAESIYDTLIDDDEGYVFVEGNGTFTKEGYASFGLILTDIPETLNGTIEFFAYAKDGSVQYLYLSETITLTYVNGALQIA